MNPRKSFMRHLICLAAVTVLCQSSLAADPFRDVTEKVNEKVVKLFGAGGFRSVTNYGTGVLVSKDGYILTIASQMLDTSEVIVHLYDGRRLGAKVVVTEPQLDIALLKINIDEDPENEDDLPSLLSEFPHFDFEKAAERKPAKPGEWVLSFANQFEIAMRDEPVSVQRGVIAAYAKLHGRRGIFNFPYTGNVYIVDAITNNPGAGGGALTDRNGALLGLIGREIRNSLSETWMNYAIPINAVTEVRLDDKTVSISIPEFVTKGMKGEYKPVEVTQNNNGPGGYHGIGFLPNILSRTPPYVEDVERDSPAAKAGVQVDDLVSFINGEPIYSIEAFNTFMAQTRPDDKIRLEVRRGQGLVTIDVTLADYPKTEKPAEPAPKK